METKCSKHAEVTVVNHTVFFDSTQIEKKKLFSLWLEEFLGLNDQKTQYNTEIKMTTTFIQ